MKKNAVEGLVLTPRVVRRDNLPKGHQSHGYRSACLLFLSLCLLLYSLQLQVNKLLRGLAFLLRLYLQLLTANFPLRLRAILTEQLDGPPQL